MKTLRTAGLGIVAISLGFVLFVASEMRDHSGLVTLANLLEWGYRAWLGMLAAVFGLAIYWAGTRRQCTQCAETMNYQARICPHCKHEVTEEKPVEWPAY